MNPGRPTETRTQSPPGDPEPTARQGVRPTPLLVALLLTALLWFAFVATRAAHEMEVGAASTLLTLAFVAFVHRCSPNRISVHARDIGQAWRIPGYVLKDTWEMITVLVKDLLGIAPAQSLFRVAPFQPVNEDPEHLGRRVLATAFTTSTPSIIVIGVDVEQHRMLFHQIRRSDLPVMTQALGAHAPAETNP